MAENSSSEQVTKVTHTETFTHRVTDSVETGLSPKQQESPRKKVMREIPFALLFCVLMAAVATWFDHTSVGEEFSTFAYRVLQGRLTDSKEPKDVTVVDISGLPPDQDSQITPRGPLLTLIQEIARHNPKVIGVDIDFSPELINGRLKFIDAEDPKTFFPSCQNLKPPVHVYLGIYRTQHLSPDLWLGLPQYQPLAAALLVPRTLKRSIWSLSEAKPDSGEGPASPPRARTMNAALAASFGHLGEKESGWQQFRQHFFDLVLREQVADLHFNAFYINYSARKSLVERAIKLEKDDFSDQSSSLKDLMRRRREDLEGKVVLIGDLTKAEQEDVFQDPAKEEPIPGVLVHASAVNTLISSPLYAFPVQNQFGLDLIFSFLILSLIISVRLIYLEEVNETRLVWLINSGVAASVFLFGWSVNITGVLWPDFLLLSVGLILHPSAHRRCERLKDHFFRWIQQPEGKE
jgi:CHASE2 domain